MRIVEDLNCAASRHRHASTLTEHDFGVVDWSSVAVEFFVVAEVPDPKRPIFLLLRTYKRITNLIFLSSPVVAI